MVEAKPYFSIVIPVFNRENEVRRAVASCLAQTFADFEVVVVDDGSTDRTPDIVTGIPDPRVRLVRHDRNRGVCPARNTGFRASAGDWIVSLDSDDELLPACLARAFEVTGSSTDNVGRFGFMYRYDDGRLSPFPLPPELTLGYVEWLHWIEIVQRSDALWITRRACFERCPMAESSALEFSYGLNFTRSFKTRILEEALALEHTDSPDRLSYRALPGDPDAIRRRMLDEVEDWQHVLAEHGAALKEHSPKRYQAVLRATSLAYTLLGLRWQGVNASVRCLSSNPASLTKPTNWATLMLAIAGRRCALGVLRARTRRLRTACATRSTRCSSPA